VKPDIREMPIDEIQVRKVYRDLVPKPSARDLELLRAEIEANGLDPSRPLVVNEDLVLLDGHSRLEIAQDLGLEWVWVTVKDLEDHWAEREYVIKANLARRQLNTAQRAELGLQLLEIEREKAKKRQQLSGQLYGRGKEPVSQEEFLLQWVRSLQEEAAREGAEKVSAILREPITSEQDQSGKATEIVAQQVGVGTRTLEQAQAIQRAAAADPEVAAEWEAAKEGKTTVNRVYRKIKVKNAKKHYGAGIGPGPFSLKLEDPEEEPERVYSDEEKWELLWLFAEHFPVSKESLRWVMENDKGAWFYWHHMVHGTIIESIAWEFIMDRVERYEQEQIAKLVIERPLPEGAESLGPWALDHAHVCSMEELLRTFPEERAHMVFTDARRSSREQLEQLAAFGQRALVPGKCLCLYVPQGLVPEVCQSMSAHGLQYLWTCAVARPRDKDYHPLYAVIDVVNQWWMLMIFQKPGPAARQLERLEDCDDGEVFPVPPFPGGGRGDAVVSSQVFVKDLPCHLVQTFTLPGQLIVDPNVRDGGVVGMVAKETRRRHLLFHSNPERAMAAEFYVGQEERWQRTRH